MSQHGAFPLSSLSCESLVQAATPAGSAGPRRGHRAAAWLQPGAELQGQAAKGVAMPQCTVETRPLLRGQRSVAKMETWTSERLVGVLGGQGSRGFSRVVKTQGTALATERRAEPHTPTPQLSPPSRAVSQVPTR